MMELYCISYTLLVACVRLEHSQITLLKIINTFIIGAVQPEWKCRRFDLSIWEMIKKIILVIVCTDLSGKEPYRQARTSEGLVGVMVRTLVRNGRDVGLIPALGAIFFIFINHPWYYYCHSYVVGLHLGLPWSITTTWPDGTAEWVENLSHVLTDRGIRTDGFKFWLSQTNDL